MGFGFVCVFRLGFGGVGLVFLVGFLVVCLFGCWSWIAAVVSGCLVVLVVVVLWGGVVLGWVCCAGVFSFAFVWGLFGGVLCVFVLLWCILILFVGGMLVWFVGYIVTC